MSIKFNGPFYKVSAQEAEVAEARLRGDIDMFMLLQFDPTRVVTVMVWKLKIAYDFYKVEQQNLSLFDTDVFKFLDIFIPIMDDPRVRKWWEANQSQEEENSGLFMLVEMAYNLKRISYF